MINQLGAELMNLCLYWPGTIIADKFENFKKPIFCNCVKTETDERGKIAERLNIWPGV